MNGTTRLKIGDINKNLICVLCGGYLIDATTIIECLHSFCRTCIVTFLKTSRTCPVCDTVVHKTRPHQNIRSDKLLQDLVYKLVPGLYKDEMRRRREFYTLHYEAAPKRAGEERGDEMSDRFTFTEEENISLALYLCPDGGNERFGFRRVFNTKDDLKTRMDRRIKESVDVRYLQCKAGVTVGLLKKFLRLKYSLSAQFQIDIFYNDEPLRNCYTLCDIAYIFNWRRRAPLVMTFCVYESSKSTKKSVESVSCKHSTSVADQLAPTDEPGKSSDKCNMSKPLSSIDCAVPSTSTIAQPLSHLTQKKSKSSKSLLVSSTSKACPTNSSFKSNLVKDEPSSSSEVTQKKNTVSCLAASTTTDTTSASNVKKSSSDKRKAETLTEASSSKKRRKNTSDATNELLLPAESLGSSSTQTQAFKSKGEPSSIKVETRPVTTVGPMLSVVIACSTNAPSPSSVSQPKLFSLLNSSLSCKTSTVTISTETPPHTTCTVTPASTLGPAVTTTVHSQIVSTPASTLSTSTAALTPTTTNSSSLLFTSSPSHCSSLLATSVLATSSTVSPQTPSPFVAYPTHRVHQKIRKVNADTENQSKNKSGLLGKRPANTPIPIAPAPAKVQNYCPPSADLSRLIPLDPGLYNSIRQSSHLAKQTPVCSSSSLVYGKVKSSKSVSNKNLTPTTTTTLKFSVTSLLSSTPVKSNSLVSVAQDNKHTISTIINTGANDKKTPSNLLVQALSKSKNVCRVEQFSSQVLPKSCQSVHSLQYTTTYDSTSLVSSTSVSSPTPASSASPTPAAVPPQQSQTQGSDALTKSQTSHISLKSEIRGSDITAIKSQIQGSDTAIRPQTQDLNTMIKSETVGSDTDIKPPTLESNTNFITTFKQEPGTSCVDQKVSYPASVEKSKACSKSLLNLKAASVSTSISEKSNATKSEPEAQKVTVSKDEHITAVCQRTVPSPNVQSSTLPSVPVVPKSSSPEYNVSPQGSTLSPTGCNNLPCPSRKQSSTQKKKIADIANTLLQNQNSKSPHQPHLSRKSVQNQPGKHVSLPLLNNEFYLGMMNGQHNGNRMGSCPDSDEPLNLVKRKEVSCLPNGMYILDVPNNSQGHKKL